MYLHWLQLESFRNYDHLELNFTAPITALVGLNAQGKTNLLESVAFLALGKSFRSSRSAETVQWGKEYGRIQGRVGQEGKEVELEVFMQRTPELKKVKKEGKVVSPKEFLGNLKVVLFTPDHLDLVTGSPSGRRQFIDRLLIQMSSSYVEAFGQYQRILEQRNALLKAVAQGRARESDLDPWDEQLMGMAQEVWKARQPFLDFLKHGLEADYRSIAGTEESIRVSYESHQDRYEERLAAAREWDLKTGATSVGPHRDDFTLLLDGKAFKESASRGECRSIVLALKMAELRYMEQETEQKPLLLLDDVFSELDAGRQKKLGELVGAHQTILTTTSKDHLHNLEKVTILEVAEGSIR